MCLPLFLHYDNYIVNAFQGPKYLTNQHLKDVAFNERLKNAT